VIEWQYITGHRPEENPLRLQQVSGTTLADTLPEATAYAICAHRRRHGIEPTDLRLWRVATVDA
jgi:hypothetical protein